MAKPGRFAVSDCSGAPLHRLSYGQVFVGDHRQQRGAGTLLDGDDREASPSPSAVSTSIANLSRRRSRSARSRRRFAYACDAATLAACLIVCLPEAASLIDGDCTPY
jgi:hypothetical protein